MNFNTLGPVGAGGEGWENPTTAIPQRSGCASDAAGPMTIYWIRVRWTSTRTEATRYYATSLERWLFKISLGEYGAVLAEGEMTGEKASPEAR